MSWNEETGRTDHTALMREVKNMDVSSLHYVREDCRSAIEAMPEGKKAGHYTDTMHYIGMRLKALESS